MLSIFCFAASASTKVNLSSKRDHVRHNEPFSRSSDGITTERRSTYRDDYPSRRSEYFDSPPRTSRGANRRTPLCEEESYSRRIERPSYQENYNHDYSSFSAAKRPHYAVVCHSYWILCFFMFLDFNVSMHNFLITTILVHVVRMICILAMADNQERAMIIMVGVLLLYNSMVKVITMMVNLQGFVYFCFGPYKFV